MSKSMDFVVTLQEDGSFNIDWGTTEFLWESRSGAVWDEDEQEHRWAEEEEDGRWSNKGKIELEMRLRAL